MHVRKTETRIACKVETANPDDSKLTVRCSCEYDEDD